jgi:poly(hydroxyalkanoate) depolymerase family esterase
MRIPGCLVVLAFLGSPSSAGTMQPVASFGDNPGALAMYEYVPANLAPERPLVVVLHGCTQQAAAMESAGWNTLADELGFAVLYPEQQTANNPVRCFNWAGEYGDPANLERGKGENQSILSMIDTAIATHRSARDRVYVVGFSAGAAFAAVLLATWPERFAAGAIMAGIPYRCAMSVSGAFSCQSPGVAKSPAEWGDLVRAAHDHAGSWPRIQIWQGTADATVKPVNSDELVDQWTNVHGADQTAEVVEEIGKLVRREFRAGTKVVVETNAITGMGHAVAIGGTGCPAKLAAYFSEQGICSTLRAAEFFGLRGSGDPGGGSGSGSGSGSGEPPTESGGCNAGRGDGLVLLLVLGLGLVLRGRR